MTDTTSHDVYLTRQSTSIRRSSFDRLRAALLHDTAEDTDATHDEIESHFGFRVRSIVIEVTDDKTLQKPERKAAQIAHAPHLSVEARSLKLADKISNVFDQQLAESRRAMRKSD